MNLLHEAILDMTDLLVNYGFKPDEAFEEAKKFWKKHNKKLKEVL